MSWGTVATLAPYLSLGGTSVVLGVLAWAYHRQLADVRLALNLSQARADEWRARYDASQLEADEMLAEHQAALAESETLRREQVRRLEGVIEALRRDIVGLEVDLDASTSVPALRARLRRLLSPE